MQTAQETSSPEDRHDHAMFLANVSRHFVSLEIEPMLEAVGRAALCVLGDICVVDRSWGVPPTRILEVRATQDAWMETPADLASVTRGEIRLDGERVAHQRSDRHRQRSLRRISFARNDGSAHSAADLALAQELGERLALAIRNVREHKKLVDALGDRERLISIAAHELRGPLCSVRLCLQSLQRSRVPLAPKATRMLEIMIKEERRVARLIDDLARSRTHPVGTARARPVVLRPVRASFARSAAQMEVQAAGAGSKLNVDLRGTGRRTLGPIAAESGRHESGQQRRQVRTGTPGRSFGSAGRQTAHRARLEVTDSGLGIAPELHGRIFEPFKRAVSDRSARRAGPGLYIVRSIVQQLGGAVRVDSRPGSGATFVVELPFRSLTDIIRASRPRW